MEKPWLIYILFDPRLPDVVRYVGKTSTKLRQRYAAHLSNRDQTYSAKWIRKLKAEGILPVIQEVERGIGDGWVAAEQRWIRFYRDRGHRLCNLTDGGEGSVNPAPEVRARMSAAKKGRPPVGMTAESYRKAAATRKAAIASGELVLPPATPESIAKRAAKCRETWVRKRAEGWTVPENWSKYRPDNTGHLVSEETRRKIGDKNRGRVMSPEARAKMSAARMGKPPANKGKPCSPERLAKLQAGRLAYLARRQAEKLAQAVVSSPSDALPLAAQDQTVWPERRHHAREAAEVTQELVGLADGAAFTAELVHLPEAI